jgi:uncharacterized membrane protein
MGESDPSNTLQRDEHGVIIRDDANSEAAQATRSTLGMRLNSLPLSAPFAWWMAGWRDLFQAPWVGLFFGGCFFIMGHILLKAFESATEYVLALSAGFLLMGPFMCLGLYRTSKALQQGQRPSLSQALDAWLPSAGTLALFAAVLLVLEMLWARASLIVFALSFDVVPEESNPMKQLLSAENLDFVIAYLAVGGVFAGLIFMASVVAIPMIMDRKVDAITAALTSFRACFTNPLVMFIWGGTITVTIVLAMLPYFLGLIVMGPVMGYASWHAYRAIVPVDQGAAAR